MNLAKYLNAQVLIGLSFVFASLTQIHKEDEFTGKLRFREMAIDAQGLYDLQKLDLRTLFFYSSYDNRRVARDHVNLVLYAISKTENDIDVAGLKLRPLEKKDARLLNNERQFSIYEISSSQIGDIEKDPRSKGAVNFILSPKLDPSARVVYEIIPADRDLTPLRVLGADGKIAAMREAIATLNPSPPAKPNGTND
jgi:hypothetical protein